MSNAERPIVVDGYQITSYPDDTIHHSLKELFCKEGLATHHLKRAHPVLRLLECFLGVPGFDLSRGDTCMANATVVIPLFIGALNSDTFLGSSTARRYALSSTVLAALGHLPSSPITVSVVRPTAHVESLRYKFESLALIPEKVWYWRGWQVRTASNEVMWLPFHSIATRFDKDFITDLHAVVLTFIAGQRSNSLHGLREFVDLLASTPGLTKDDLLSPGYMITFWQRLWEHYKAERLTRDTPSTLLANWSNNWTGFVKRHLIPANLVAPLIEEDLPGPTNSDMGAWHDSSLGDSEAQGANLLVDIPLAVSDSEAWNLLLCEVPEAISNVRNWATEQADDLIARRRRAIQLAQSGTAISSESLYSNESKWRKSQKNPSNLADAAATFATRGYQAHDKAYYPTPISTTIFKLGLPASYSLIPHATLIVLNHSEITSAFLDDLDLYDKNGKMVGLSKQGNINYLVGLKRRRGAQLARQTIALNEEALLRIEEIIEITEPCRVYLKNRGNDSWRKLFIECGPGFSIPRAISFTKSINVIKYDGSLLESFSKCKGITSSTATSLAQRFTLKNLRATLGVKKFMETHSEEEAAQALGHHELNFQLLSRYLPPALVAFYRNRWVRAFQNSILILCTEDSNLQLRATGFKSLTELNKFIADEAFLQLKNTLASADTDAIESPDKPNTSDDPARENGKFIFNANLSNLVAIHCIDAGQYTLHEPGDQLFWSSFSTHMIKNLSERAHYDANLKALMLRAKQVCESVDGK